MRFTAFPVRWSVVLSLAPKECISVTGSPGYRNAGALTPLIAKLYLPLEDNPAELAIKAMATRFWPGYGTTRNAVPSRFEA